MVSDTIFFLVWALLFIFWAILFRFDFYHLNLLKLRTDNTQKIVILLTFQWSSIYALDI